MGYLMPNPSLLKEQTLILFNLRLGNEGLHRFAKGISPEENAIVRLEFELAYFEAVVQHLCHYATSTPCNGLNSHPEKGVDN